MNQARIIRADVTREGLGLRLYVYDEADRIESVAELVITDDHLAGYAREVQADRNRAAQYMLTFDD